MVKRSGGRLVIRYETQVSWGFAPIPKTSYELTTDGSADWVQMRHTDGERKKTVKVPVPVGSYIFWLKRLQEIGDKKSVFDGHSLVMDGYSSDLWFESGGATVHLHWMGELSEDKKVMSEMVRWLCQNFDDL